MPRISLEHCYRPGRLGHPDDWNPTSFPTILEFLLALHEGSDDEAFRALHRFLSVSEREPVGSDEDSFFFLLDSVNDIGYELRKLAEELQHHDSTDQEGHSRLIERLIFILPAFEFGNIGTFDNDYFEMGTQASEIDCFTRPMKAFRFDFEQLRKEVIGLIVETHDWLYGFTMERFGSLWFDEDEPFGDSNDRDDAGREVATSNRKSTTERKHVSYAELMIELRVSRSTLLRFVKEFHLIPIALKRKQGSPKQLFDRETFLHSWAIAEGMKQGENAY